MNLSVEERQERDSLYQRACKGQLKNYAECYRLVELWNKEREVESSIVENMEDWMRESFNDPSFLSAKRQSR